MVTLEAELAQKVVLLSKEDEQEVRGRLERMSYGKLVAIAIALGILALIPDCLPFIDEFFLISMNGAVVVALMKKILRDLGVF